MNWWTARTLRHRLDAPLTERANARTRQRRSQTRLFGDDEPTNVDVNLDLVARRSGASRLTEVQGTVSPVGTDREIVAFRVRRDTRCSECSDELFRGSLLRLEDKAALCLRCADLDHLEFLPSGDTALTRRARKYSVLQAVVVEWSRSRKRYERQGVLVEASALEQAEAECLADADVRARQRERAALRRSSDDDAFIASFAAAIHSQYPGCPVNEATQIAAHACQRYSGRIGRTAAARSLDPDAIRLAVVAHIRHVHTDYDRLLTQLQDRQLARDLIGDSLDLTLRHWAQPSNPPP
jgi:hypothetical protein